RARSSRSNDLGGRGGRRDEWRHRAAAMALREGCKYTECAVTRGWRYALNRRRDCRWFCHPVDWTILDRRRVVVRDRRADFVVELRNRTRDVKYSARRHAARNEPGGCGI